ncbi:MAG: hypothetical protein RL026_398 [Pseudomonadota bacterium]|jgi:general secretion pathway protein C
MASILQFPGLDAARQAALFARVPQAATAVLGLLLGWRVALLAMDVVAPLPAGSDADLAIRPGAPAITPPLDIEALLAARLFGDEAAAPASMVAEATQLPLVLAGILADRDPARGVAIVGETAAAARVFRVGDSLPGGVRLQAVNPDHVVLDRGGRLETLRLPRQSSAAAPPAARAASSGSPTADVASRAQRLLQQSPGLVGDVLRPQAVLADGKQHGYRVYPGPNAQAFNRLGLRPGDLVTAINGSPLDDPETSSTVFSTLGSAASARLTIMRNGRQQDLVLNLTETLAELSNAPPGAADADE